MSQMPSNAPLMESKPGPAGWLPVWTKAVTQPNEQTFIEISEHPDAKSRTAFLWIFIAGTVAALIAGLIQALLVATGLGAQPVSGVEGLPTDFMPALVGGSLVATICGAPVYGVFSVIGFAIGASIIQWVAKLFGGAGTFDKMAYAIAAISVPVTLISMLLSPFNAVPYLNICTGLLLFGLGIYAIFLQVTAVKAVNRFGWGAALGSVFLPGIVVVVVCGCLFAVLFAVLGASFSEVFNQINQSLQSVP